MLAHLVDVSIRSILLAVPAVIVLWLLKGRRTAALQHAVWTAVVIGMLGLFAFGQTLPRLPLRILQRPTAAVQATPPAPALDRPIIMQNATPVTNARTAIGWQVIVLYGYLGIAFAFLAHFVTGMFLACRLLTTAHPISRAGLRNVYESEGIAIPVTVGWARPKILLPPEWQEWGGEKLEAVLAHEGAHVRRHDGLVAVLAGMNRCLFWFHPLAWMLERKLALLAEQASAPLTQAVQIAQVQPTPKFESAAIKPCTAGDGAGHTGRGGVGGRGIPMSPPGKLYVNCMSAAELISHYVEEGNAPLLNDTKWPADAFQRVRGGPAWLYSNLYTIDAESSDPVANAPGPRGNANFKLLSGPMLEALIEARFQLKPHRAIEESPMYALTIASSGFKLQPAEGGCILHTPGSPLLIPKVLPPGQKPPCISHAGWDGPNWSIDAAGQPLSQLAILLSGLILGRPVLDKTGIAGSFTFHVVFAHDANAPGQFPAGVPGPFAPTDVPAAPSINVVLEQQLGLEVVPDKGPREYIAIDSVQPPRL